MALVRYSSIIGALSGNIANLNFVHGRSGPVVRKARKSTRQLSTAQLRNQSFMTILTNGWRALTDDQRHSFQTAALQLTRTNALGVPKNLSGRQLYFALRLRDLAFGLVNAITQPPPPTALPPILDLTILTTAPSTIEIDWTIPASIGLTRVYVYGARSLSTTPSKFFSSHKALSALPTLGPPVDISTAFAAALGVPQSGELISIKTILGNLDNMPTAPTFAQTHMA